MEALASVYSVQHGRESRATVPSRTRHVTDRGLCTCQRCKRALPRNRAFHEPPNTRAISSGTASTEGVLPETTLGSNERTNCLAG